MFSPQRVRLWRNKKRHGYGRATPALGSKDFCSDAQLRTDTSLISEGQSSQAEEPSVKFERLGAAI